MPQLCSKIIAKLKAVLVLKESNCFLAQSSQIFIEIQKYSAPNNWQSVAFNKKLSIIQKSKEYKLWWRKNQSVDNIRRNDTDDIIIDGH